MDKKLLNAIDDLFTACNQVRTAERKVSPQDTRLRRAVQHLTKAEQIVKELLDEADNASSPTTQ
jgi:hypothetical protein